jgi:hypothetical protein
MAKCKRCKIRDQVNDDNDDGLCFWCRPDKTPVSQREEIRTVMASLDQNENARMPLRTRQ